MNLVSGAIIQVARKLRRNQTKSERLIWQKVRNRMLKGKKFIRQHPLCFEIDGKKRFFIADFYCSEKKLVIEIDGKIHLRQKNYDELRTYVINKLGIRVIRFTNEHVENDIESVLNCIGGYL